MNFLLDHIPYYPQPSFDLGAKLGMEPGKLVIYSFGFLVCLAVITGAAVIKRRAQKYGIEGDRAIDFVVWVVVSGFIVAHLFHCFIYYPQDLFKVDTEGNEYFDWWFVLNPSSGLSSFGGFIGGVIGALIFPLKNPSKLRIENIGFRAKLASAGGIASMILVPIIDLLLLVPVVLINIGRGIKDRFTHKVPHRVRLLFMDITLYGFTFGWIFGRMGCATAHDHPGTKTDFFLAPGSWRDAEGILHGWPMFDEDGKQMIGVDNSPLIFDGARHDLGLYEMLIFILFAILFYYLGKKPRFVGFYLLLLPILYAPVRFGFEFLRIVDKRYEFLGLDYTPAQWISILLLFGCGILFIKLRKSSPVVEFGSFRESVEKKTEEVKTPEVKNTDPAKF
ncbi:MAG: prolipoprotein diacylglyceryl transferase [Planctomycetes bacterium]|nr:prolipoprotein diacylglyceryl transferase [Planctomycetota bacterium]